MANAEMGIKIKSCAACRNENIGAMIKDMFTIQRGYNPDIRFDNEAHEIIMSEIMLSRIIGMVNNDSRLDGCRIRLAGAKETNRHEQS